MKKQYWGKIKNLIVQKQEYQPENNEFKQIFPI